MLTPCWGREHYECGGEHFLPNMTEQTVRRCKRPPDMMACAADQHETSQKARNVFRCWHLDIIDNSMP